MKSFSFMFLIAMFLCGNQAFAQKVLLPYGQETREPWEAKYIHALNDNEAGQPEANWMDFDFDDSSWGTMEGPIASLNRYYYATRWNNYYSTYWLRRYFEVEDLNEQSLLFMKTLYDDGCEIYLNGHLIYKGGPYISVTLSYDITKEALPYLKEGENVIAIKAVDSGAGNAYFDFGLQSFYSLVDSAFNYENTWEGSFSRTSSDNNSIAYKYDNNWSCEQKVHNLPEGLYCLSANTCGLENYNDFNKAYETREGETSARLFINEKEKFIPSSFSEIADSKIYNSNYWEVNGGLVPNRPESLPAAFNAGMYSTKIFSFYEPDSTNILKVGIHCNVNKSSYHWAAWDNMNLILINPEDLNNMMDSLQKEQRLLSLKKLDKKIKDILIGNLTEAEKTDSYKEKGLLFVQMIDYEPTVRRSIKEYENLKNVYDSFSDSLSRVSDKTSPATATEAKTFADQVLNAYNQGNFNNEQVNYAIARMNKLMQRLSYPYIDVTITTPGTLGDSILTKVEYFNQVVSLKISGELNSSDIATIKDRLVSLRELDLTDLYLLEVPERMFYEWRQLEIVRLPKDLARIGNYAFYRCNNLLSIEFPSTFKSIGDYAFYECISIPELVLPEGLTYLGTWSFAGTRIKSAKFPTTLTKISNHAFYHSWEIKDLYFSEGLEKIEESAFEGCPVLDNVVFPSTLTDIGSSAFNSCSTLSKIEFNEGLYQIANRAFYDCDAITEITLPSTLVFANQLPFGYCDNLMKVTCLAFEPPYLSEQNSFGTSMTGRELYVPTLSINTYKQTKGWDNFPTINPIDYLPENINILGEMHLTLPENIPSEYKPNLSLIYASKEGYLRYGSLSVNGTGTLSLHDYSMFWDPTYMLDYSERSTCYCSMVNNSHLRADNVSVTLDAPDGRWTFLSLPFDIKISDIETPAAGTTNWVIRKYDGQKRSEGETENTWIKLTENDVINAGEGFIIQGSRYVNNSRQDWSRFTLKAVNNGNKNNIFNTTDVVVNLKEYPSEFAHNRSWNLIGNPYPSFYDTRFMDFIAPITVWNSKKSTYNAYSPVDDSYILCPGEAFFVQRPIEIESITFGKDGRQNNRSVRTLTSTTKVASSNIETRTIINITISDDQSSDRTRLVINENAGFDYECDKDAPKFMSSELTVPQIYTSFNGVDYAINERPLDNGNATLVVRCGKDGNYRIALEKDVDNMEIIFEDRLVGKEIVLDENGYEFSSRAGTISDRFVLHLTNSLTGVESIKVEGEIDDAYYTIDGRKFNKPVHSGIYIHNKQKIFVK